MGRVIGLTGGIGSGKTTVSDYLLKKGYTIIDADLIAREVVEPACIGLKQLVAYFGETILMPDGSLDRKNLGQIIFQDESKRRVVNAIIHPLVNQRVQELLVKYHEKPLIFLVAPLLYEAGIQKYCDDVWLVTSDIDQQIERIMERDKLDRLQAKARIESQLTNEEKMIHHPVVIRNNSDLPALFVEVEKLLKKPKEL